MAVNIEEEIQSVNGECLQMMYEEIEEYQQTGFVKFGSPLRRVAGLIFDECPNKLDMSQLGSLQIPIYREYIQRLLEEREEVNK